MAYNVFQIANTILKIAKHRNIHINNIKLQKLCYFAHGINLGLFNEPLIEDPVIAYKHGPYYPNLYIASKDKDLNTGLAVFNEQNNYTNTNNNHTQKIDNNNLLNIATLGCIEYTAINDEFVTKLIEMILDTYGSMSAEELVALSHKENTPWNNTEYGSIIDDTITKSYYSQYYN